LANERAASVSFVEFKVAQASASNLYHWGFETPAAIAIVDELSRKAAYLLEKRVFSQCLEAVQEANLWSRWPKPAVQRASFRADLYLSDTNILRLKIALRATLVGFAARWWEVDVIFGLHALDASKQIHLIDRFRDNRAPATTRVNREKPVDGRAKRSACIWRT